MSRQKPVIHGRDHEPGGADPVTRSIRVTGTDGSVIDPATTLEIANDDTLFPSGFLLVQSGDTAILFNTAPKFDADNEPADSDAGHFWHTHIEDTTGSPTLFSDILQNASEVKLDARGAAGSVSVILDPDNQEATGAGVTISVGDSGLDVTVRLAATGTSFTVTDHSGNPIFRVDEDGDLHGKTGKALTFDL